MKSKSCFIISLVCGLLPGVISTFDEPIDGPVGSLLFHDYRQRNIQIYDVPSGDLKIDLRIIGVTFDACYWPKARSLLTTKGFLGINIVDVWGDQTERSFIGAPGSREPWLYVRAEMRENWLLGGAVNLDSSRLNLYRITVHDNMTVANISLLASESIFSSVNLLLQPTMSPENRYVYAPNTLGIFRVPYDGGPIEQIVSDFVLHPTVNVKERRLFYIGFGGSTFNLVMSCDLDGSNLTTIYNSSFRIDGVDQYGDWLVVSEENGRKQYQFINLKTNETRTILNPTYYGPNFAVKRLDFVAFGEVYKAHSLVSPALVRPGNERSVSVTTALSSAGGFQHQYLSSFERLASTGTISGFSQSSRLDYSGLQPAELVIESEGSKRVDERTGVYLQRIVTPYGDEETITMVLQSKGELRFRKPTVTLNVGDDFTLSVPKLRQRLIRWQHNGRLIPEWSRSRSGTILNITTADAGVYESYLWRRRNRGKHGIMRLIVRGCPSGYCNPPNCTEECPVCYNGGVPIDYAADDKPCICAPGFMGNYCSIASPAGRFGEDGELSCPDDDCEGALICQPDPYGCSCAAGFGGPGCNQRCRAGTFGANCELRCNCMNNRRCDRATGSCQDAGGCQLGWSGDNCQIATI